MTGSIGPSPPSTVLRRLPIALTATRALLAPVVVLLAVVWPRPGAFALCLVIAFLSDVFDGIVARRLGIATPSLRRLDSVADSLFYLAATFAAWRLHPAAFASNRNALIALVALEAARYAFDLAKFGREASYHLWSSKLWGIALFAGFVSLLVYGEAGIVVTAMIWIGIAADLEGLLVSLVLRHWSTDVPTLVHALRLRRVDGAAT